MRTESFGWIEGGQVAYNSRLLVIFGQSFCRCTSECCLKRDYLILFICFCFAIESNFYRGFVRSKYGSVRYIRRLLAGSELTDVRRHGLPRYLRMLADQCTSSAFVLVSKSIQSGVDRLQVHSSQPQMLLTRSALTTNIPSWI